MGRLDFTFSPFQCVQELIFNEVIEIPVRVHVDVRMNRHPVVKSSCRTLSFTGDNKSRQWHRLVPVVSTKELSGELNDIGLNTGLSRGVYKGQRFFDCLDVTYIL